MYYKVFRKERYTRFCSCGLVVKGIYVTFEILEQIYNFLKTRSVLVACFRLWQNFIALPLGFFNSVCWTKNCVSTLMTINQLPSDTIMYTQLNLGFSMRFFIFPFRRCRTKLPLYCYNWREIPKTFLHLYGRQKW